MGGAGALLEAATRGDAPTLAALLRAHPQHIDATDEIGRTALQRAAAEGHVQCVQLLLQHNADVNKQDHVYGNSALHEAAWKGYSLCVRSVARAGATLDALNAAGFSALHFAAQHGHNQSARELLLAGAHPDFPNTYGDTALHTAARYGHAGVTRILVSVACAVAALNRNGDSALHIAAAMGRRKLTRLLLEAGADPRARNMQGETAADIARRKGLLEIERILSAPPAAPPAARPARRRDRSAARPPPDSAPKDPKDKKKKNVRFETAPRVPWSPYGCHYYPDPKFFPEPKLSSLPPEPLKKGEQYYLDLAGNIKKGPIGAGYTCYCAPFFKHMEDKLNEDKNDLKRHIDRAHEKLDQKVTDLEMKTQGRISELTRFVAAERAHCRQRHEHLARWLTRAEPQRASERVRRRDRSPQPAGDLKRTRSLEVLDADEMGTVHRIVRTFDDDRGRPETDGRAPLDPRLTSRSTELLDRRSPSPAARPLRSSRSSPHLDAGPSRPASSPSRHVPAEIHVDSDRTSAARSLASPEIRSERYSWRGRPETAFPGAPPPVWRSRVLQQVAPLPPPSLHISPDGYIALRKSSEDAVEREPRKSVQELVDRVERQRFRSPEPLLSNGSPPETRELPPPRPDPAPISSGILKISQQPQRPAPLLKEKPPRSKRFSLSNLIPFPSRKTFRPAAREPGNESESSEEEEPRPPAPAPPADYLVPRDAYFHELPARCRSPLGAASLAPLQARLAQLAVDTGLAGAGAGRDSHNDSGYSTKVYGSSQGPSPSLSGHAAASLV